jgi:hypothetical protein
LFQFPTVDPIPLPAPVWLFKLLHDVTLLLHFSAMYLMVGGLSLAVVWNFFGRGENSPARGASNSIVGKLPTVMTYVINFGVPPLLFAQVLYGRALYTSSVLVGFYWFSVVIVLTLAYFLLYRAADRAAENKAWWGYGLLSLVGVAYIAKVFSMNMALMLRPEDWQALYQASDGLGNVVPTGDPTRLPRFLFMMTGAFGFAGAGLAVLGAFAEKNAETGDFLRVWGARLAILLTLAQAGIGYWVYSAQPPAVQNGLFENPLFAAGLYGWLALTPLSLAASALVLFGGRAKAKLLSAAAVLTLVLSTAAAVLVRDGIRDLTLLAKNFDVWNRTVVSNWSVVLLFLGLFVGGLALIGVVLVAVSRSAKKFAAQHAEPQETGI